LPSAPEPRACGIISIAYSVRDDRGLVWLRAYVAIPMPSDRRASYVRNSRSGGREPSPPVQVPPSKRRSFRCAQCGLQSNAPDRKHGVSKRIFFRKSAHKSPYFPTLLEPRRLAKPNCLLHLRTTNRSLKGRGPSKGQSSPWNDPIPEGVHFVVALNGLGGLRDRMAQGIARARLG
jgi:hypothetical protein